MHKTNLKCVYLLKLQDNNELLKRLILLKFITLLSRLFRTGTTLSLKKMFTNVQSRVGQEQLVIMTAGYATGSQCKIITKFQIDKTN